MACNQSESTTEKSVPYRYWLSNSVRSNGIRLHYWRTGGAGKPVMIMAHGITDYGLNWSSLAAKFENSYDIIMYDARGHGFSQKPDSSYSLSIHVEDLKGLIDALDIKKPIKTIEDTQFENFIEQQKQQKAKREYELNNTGIALLKDRLIT